MPLDEFKIFLHNLISETIYTCSRPSVTPCVSSGEVRGRRPGAASGPEEDKWLRTEAPGQSVVGKLFGRQSGKSSRAAVCRPLPSFYEGSEKESTTR